MRKVISSMAFRMKNMDRTKWVNLQKQLLEKERKAELLSFYPDSGLSNVKSLVEKGNALNHLQLAERSTGLYGSFIYTFELPNKKPFPVNNFSTGDIVCVWGTLLEKNQKVVSGIVMNVNQNVLKISADEDHYDEDELYDCSQFVVQKLPSDVTFRRLKKGLEQALNYRDSCASFLLEIIFGESLPLLETSTLPSQLLDYEGQFIFFNDSLNSSQKDAVKMCLSRKDVAIIHGPPGTGKTTTLIEVIRQSVKMKNKVLVCAPSNLAVDNIIEKLSQNKIRMVRIGHPARASKATQNHTLDALIYNRDEALLIEDINQDISKCLLDLRKTRNKIQRSKIKSELKHFRKELKERQLKMTKDLLLHADVVLCTLTSAGDDGPLRILPENHFTLLVIDECSQAIESACYLPILKTSKVVLAGDHKQLPPTIISEEAAKEGLMCSLMERLIDAFGTMIVKMLDVQYRMNSRIMNWASNAMYDDKLQADLSVANHTLLELPGVMKTEDTENVLILVDTDGCGCEELNLDEEQSKGNKGEAVIVAAHVENLLSAGVKDEQVAVITPYNMQVGIIRDLLKEKHPNIEVSSVDGFQGREKEAVIISLVRSNPHGEVGFLAEDRRLNVAVTRAKRHLAIVCDSSTVSNHKFLKNFIDYMFQNALMRSSLEYENELNSAGIYITYENVPSGEKLGCRNIKPIKEVKEPSNKKEKDKNNKNLEADSSQNCENRDLEKSKFEDLFLDFLNSSETKLIFPPDLTSYQRMIAHDIADRLHLKHKSVGKGKERHLQVFKSTEACKEDLENKATCTENFGKCDQHTLSKTNHIEEICENSDNDDKCLDTCSNSDIKLRYDPKDEKLLASQQKLNTLVSVEKKLYIRTMSGNGKGSAVVSSCTSVSSDTICDKSLKFCFGCKKKVLLQNYEMHFAHCQKQLMARQQRHSEKFKNKKKKQKEKTAENIEDEDFDDLVESFVQKDNVCSFHKCKTPTTVIFQQCPFCKQTFCLSHYLAEVHGCGDAAKTHARKMVIRDGIIYPGSGVPSKKPTDAERARLQKTLKKKLDEFSSQRKPKAHNK